jgi:hypothetical protein
VDGGPVPVMLSRRDPPFDLMEETTGGMSISNAVAWGRGVAWISVNSKDFAASNCRFSDENQQFVVDENTNRLTNEIQKLFYHQQQLLFLLDSSINSSNSNPCQSHLHFRNAPKSLTVKNLAQLQ